MSNEKVKDNKFSGIAIAAWILLVGLTMFYIPTYFGIHNQVAVIILSMFGWLCLMISLGGALTESSKIFKNDGFNFLGVGIVFLLPSILLYLKIDILGLTFWEQLGKVVVIVLFLTGTGMFFYGISFFFKERNESVQEMKTNSRFNNLKSILEIITAFIAIAGSLLTAVLKLIEYIK